MADRKRVYLLPDQLTLARNELVREGIFLMNGLNSFYVPKYMTKYIDKTRCKLWTDLEDNELLMTPGEAARTELKREFPDIRRVGWRGPHKRLFSVPMPFFCKERQEFSGCYIDLKGAYHQIYRNLWLDVKFPCGMGSMELRPLADRIGGWKAARNSVVGVTRSMVSWGIKKGRRVKLYPENRFLTPHLWAMIQYTLHSLAIIADDMGAKYCMTDGYIIDHKNAKYLLNTLDVFGIDYRVSWGDVDIKGWTSYKVSGYKTTVAYQRRYKTQTNIRNLVSDIDDPYKYLNFVFNIGDKYYARQKRKD